MLSSPACGTVRAVRHPLKWVEGVHEQRFRTSNVMTHMLNSLTYLLLDGLHLLTINYDNYSSG